MSVDVRGLKITIGGKPIVSDADMTIADGERVGLIGSSGSGKSMIAKAMLGLLPLTAVTNGSIDMGGTEGRDPFDDYEKINKELESYQLRLLERPTVIVANKMDVAEAEEKLEVFKQKIAEKFGEDEAPRIFPISAWSTTGVAELLDYTAEVLKETPEFPLFDEEEVESSVLYKFEENQEQFTIGRDPDSTWVLGGERLEKLFNMTNFAHDESIMRFARQLRQMGVDEKLRAKGAKDGDMVRIMTYHFEFVD